MSAVAPKASMMSFTTTLCRIIYEHAPVSGDYTTCIPDLNIYRRNAPSPPITCIVEPSIVLAVQGAKELVIAGEAYAYDSGSFLVASPNVPAHSAVTNASEASPCLGLVFKLDVQTLVEIITLEGLWPATLQPPRNSIGVGTLGLKLLQSFARLIVLLEEPSAIPFLWPMIQREIHYRLYSVIKRRCSNT